MLGKLDAVNADQGDRFRLTKKRQYPLGVDLYTVRVYSHPTFIDGVTYGTVHS